MAARRRPTPASSTRSSPAPWPRSRERFPSAGDLARPRPRASRAATVEAKRAQRRDRPGRPADRRAERELAQPAEEEAGAEPSSAATVPGRARRDRAGRRRRCRSARPEAEGRAVAEPPGPRGLAVGDRAGGRRGGGTPTTPTQRPDGDRSRRRSPRRGSTGPRACGDVRRRASWRHRLCVAIDGRSASIRRRGAAEETGALDAGTSTEAVVDAGGSLWVTPSRGTTVLRLDPGDGRPGGIAVGAEPDGMAVAAATSGRQLRRQRPSHASTRSPKAGRATRSQGLLAPRDRRSAGETVYVAVEPGGRSVMRDQRRTRTGAAPAAIAGWRSPRGRSRPMASGQVWVANAGGETVTPVDGRTATRRSSTRSTWAWSRRGRVRRSSSIWVTNRVRRRHGPGGPHRPGHRRHQRG